MRSKLRYYLLLTLSAFLLVVVGGCVALYVLFATDYYMMGKGKVLENAYDYIVALDLADLRDEEIETLESYENAQTMRILIADEEENLVYASAGFTDNSLTRVVNRWITERQDAYTEDAKASHQEGLFKVGDSFLFLNGLVQQGSGSYYVCLYQDIRGAINTISYFNQFMVLLLIVTLLGGVLYALLMSWQILQPIERIDRVAGDIAEGNLSVRVEETASVGELANLTRKINKMADTIQTNLQQLQASNEQLEKQNALKDAYARMQEQFISHVTHELKTPMAIISTQAEMIEWAATQEERIEYAETIMDEVQKMSTLVSHMLEMSLQVHTITKLEKKTLDLASYMADNLLRYERLLSKQGLSLRAQLPEQCEVCCSWEEMNQIANNYVGNAAKHASEGSEILLTLEDLGEEFRLSVHNSGQPIAEEDRVRIWTGYYHMRALRDGEEDKSSVGLGLHIVQDIVKNYLGTCGFTNEGDGVTFWAQMPKNV